MYGLKLSDRKVVMTRNGERFVSNAKPTDEFWQAYRADKVAMSAAGFSVSKHNGEWRVTLWEKTQSPETRSATLALSRATDSAINLKTNPGLAYRPFQKAGIEFGISHEAMLLADEPGLGKTLQVIGIRNATDANRTLIVVPATLRINWLRELLKWTTDPIHKTPDEFKHSEETLDLLRQAGKRSGNPLFVTVMKAGMPWPTLQERHIVIINYDIASRFADEIREIEWDILAADEAHMMKSRSAKRKLAILGGEKFEKDAFGNKRKIVIFPVRARRRILMTGTPITNRTRELFPLIHYLDPRTWSSFTKFAFRYAAATQTRYGLDTSGSSNLEELQQRLRSTIMIRRLKKDVLKELPAKQRQVIDLETNGAAKLVAEELAAFEKHQKTINVLVAEAELAFASDNEALYKLAVAKLKKAQAVAFAEISKRRHEVGLAKVPQVLDFIEDLDSEKLIIFVHHKDVLQQIADGIRSFSNRGVVTISGDTKMEDRQAAIDGFQMEPSIGYIIGTIGAMNVGITLTAASHVIFAELDWVPANMLQAEDRAHRIGQENSVLVQHLVFDGSLDSRMSKVLVDKMEVIETALDKETKLDLDGPDFVRTFDDKPAKKFDDKLSAEQKTAALAGLRYIAQFDDDHASFKNDVGFNGADTHIGNALAGEPVLSPKQAALAHRILRKYRRQLPADLYGVLYS